MELASWGRGGGDGKRTDRVGSQPIQRRDVSAQRTHQAQYAVFGRRVCEQTWRLGEAGHGGDERDAFWGFYGFRVRFRAADVVVLFQICDRYPRKVQAAVQVDVDHIGDAFGCLCRRK